MPVERNIFSVSDLKDNSGPECGGLQRREERTRKRRTPKQQTRRKIHLCLAAYVVSRSVLEVLFCTGTCQAWIHRYCKSVSVNTY